MLKRDNTEGWNPIFPGDVVTLNNGDYMRVGDAVLNVHMDGTISLYSESHARHVDRRNGEPVPDGVIRE